jgi:hypothetical protein
MAISIKQHWHNVAELGCIVSGAPSPTLHHVHGGSVTQELGFDWQPGMAQKQNHFLVIPLAARLHTGNEGIDSGMGVQSWELLYGTQMDHLRAVSEALGYDVLELARATHVVKLLHH